MSNHHVDPIDEDDRTIEGADLLDEIRRRMGLAPPDPGPPPEDERFPASDVAALEGASMDLTIDGFELLRDIELSADSALRVPAAGRPGSSGALDRWKPPVLDRAEPMLFGEPGRWHLGALVVAFALGALLTLVVLSSGPFS